MRKYNLKQENKLHKIGRINFVYDKAFQGLYDKFAKFIPAKISVYIMSNETPESCIEDLKKRYKNAKNFEIILN